VLRMTELLDEVGFPPGVFNFVTGEGTSTGEALITHPMVDKITFTGSRAVGQRILAASADGIKRVSLELGGKSANLIFPDVDVNMAAMTAMGMVTMGLFGTGCVCLTRALAHRSIYDDLIQGAESLAQMVSYGDPFAETTTSGRSSTRSSWGAVTGFIEKGQQEGPAWCSAATGPAVSLRPATTSTRRCSPTSISDRDLEYERSARTISAKSLCGPAVTLGDSSSATTISA